MTLYLTENDGQFFIYNTQSTFAIHALYFLTNFCYLVKIKFLKIKQNFNSQL